MIILSIKKEYNQQPDETLAEWKYRLLIGKAKKQIKMSWTQIRDMLMLDCTADHLRHHAYGALGYETYLSSMYRESNIDTDVEDQKLSLQREKIRMQDQKRELNRQVREWARAEHIQETIMSAIAGLPALPKPRKGATKQGDHEGILMLSDWHVGMTTANCCNVFNHAVLVERVEKLIAKTIDHCQLHGVRKLHVFCLGDLVNGLIHVTTRINNEEDVIQQSMIAAELLAGMFSRLSAEMDLEVYWSRGNHDRVSANKKESVCRESFADLILWYLEARLAGYDAIHFCENEVDDEIIVTEIMSQTVFAAHGHKDKPARAVENLSLLLKQFPDLVLMGHFHSAAEREIQGADVVVNGSLCGTDDYAMSLRRTSKPSQKLIIMSRSGRECTYNIDLSDALRRDQGV
jgi:predicted phosphodiesterase